MKTRAELADFERIEPRCRVCQHPFVRRLVNDFLDWRGAPIILGPGKSHVVTYADILRGLQPINEGRDRRDQITYSCLWIHAKRHHDPDAVAAYQMAKLLKELRKTVGISNAPPK
jgi:hypothetical protein